MWFTRQDRRARLGDLKARRDVARTCAYRFSRVRVETRSFRQRLDVEFLHAHQFHAYRFTGGIEVYGHDDFERSHNDRLADLFLREPHIRSTRLRIDLHGHVCRAMIDLDYVFMFILHTSKP